MAGIAGLPPTPDRSKLKLNKSPARRGISERSVPQLGLTVTFRNGSLWMVRNRRGKRSAVAIVETGLPGFTVRVDKFPFRIMGSGFRKAEQLAVRLALRGHNRVTIRR